MKKIFYWAAGLSITLFTTGLLYAQESGAAPEKSQHFMQTLIMIGIALVFFYFILWRPEQKRRKKAEKQRNSLKQGDRATAMGIIGTVHRVKENSVILKTCDDTKIEVHKAAISDVKSPGEAEEKEVSSKKAEQINN